jgi:hypothetical protein
VVVLTVERWRRAVQYRHTCEGPCGETRMVAVIKRRDRPSVRLCLDCFLDGFWAK